MRCPVCKSVRLVHARLDDVPVRTCPHCKGFLVLTRRVDKIKTARKGFATDSFDDPAARYALDTTRNIRCTTCGQGMKKKLMSNGNDRFHIDECTKCELMWFDNFELKKLQSQYLIAEERKEKLERQVYFVHEKKSSAVHDRHNGEYRYTESTYKTTANYPCPHCDKPTSSSRVNIHHSSYPLEIAYDSYVDSCRHCGREHTVPHEPFDERLFWR